MTHFQQLRWCGSSKSTTVRFFSVKEGKLRCFFTWVKTQPIPSKLTETVPSKLDKETSLDFSRSSRLIEKM